MWRYYNRAVDDTHLYPRDRIYRCNPHHSCRGRGGLHWMSRFQVRTYHADKHVHRTCQSFPKIIHNAHLQKPAEQNIIIEQDV